jgi:hypothetical protein
MQRYWPVVFIYSVFIQFTFYRMGGRTVGDLFLKIKPIFIVKSVKKNSLYVERSFIKSIIYLPCSLSLVSFGVSILMIIGIIIFLLNPKTRSKRVMPWDSSTGMIVVNT